MTRNQLRDGSGDAQCLPEGKNTFGLLKIIVRRDVTARLECQELILTQQTENCYYSNQGIS